MNARGWFSWQTFGRLGLSWLCACSSDESSQSQLQPLGQALGSASAIQDLDLPELDDLLQDPFWQDLAVPSCLPGAACEPGCQCAPPAQPVRRQGRKVAKKQARQADQVLSSWTNISSSPASSDSSSPGRDTQQPAQALSQPQPQQAAEYPSSSHDSCHRPQSPAEALQDTSCTSQAPTVPHPLPVQQSHPQYMPQAQYVPQAPAPFQPSTPLPAFQFTEGRQHAAAGSADESNLDSEEAKKAARMQRNRESAHYSRQRKKMQSGELEKRCQDLQAHNTHLTGLSLAAVPLPACSCADAEKPLTSISCTIAVTHVVNSIIQLCRMALIWHHCTSLATYTI